MWGTTNASASVRVEYNEHGDISSESMAMISHLAYHRAYAFSFMKSLPFDQGQSTENPNSQ